MTWRLGIFIYFALADSARGACDGPIVSRVVCPSSDDYDEARGAFNEELNVFPYMILYCNSQEEVSTAVLWANAHGQRISMRAGGHSYDGNSLGNNTNASHPRGVVIDVSLMRDIRVDAASGLARIGGGVLLRDLNKALSKFGLAFPVGSCPTVGVVGYVLGGGHG